MNKPIYFFANWKMYLDNLESEKLAFDLVDYFKDKNDNISIAVLPSALSFISVKNILENSNIKIGSQNSYWIDKGGYTGEVSMQMYKSAGSNFSLIGHSERRHIFKESNHDIREKLESAIVAGLTPIICVGETGQERNDGRAEEIVEIQLRAVFENILIPDGLEIFIAYEPVWAIGTGKACNPEDAEQMHQKVLTIANVLISSANVKILYGGSVSEKNVVSYLTKDSIDGVLVGNASTKIDTVVAIHQALSKEIA